MLLASEEVLELGALLASSGSFLPRHLSKFSYDVCPMLHVTCHVLPGDPLCLVMSYACESPMQLQHDFGWAACE